MKYFGVTVEKTDAKNVESKTLVYKVNYSRFLSNFLTGAIVSLVLYNAYFIYKIITNYVG